MAVKHPYKNENTKKHYTQENDLFTTL